MDYNLFDISLRDYFTNKIKYATFRAPTGTGKSTILPTRAIELFYEINDRLPIIFYVTPNIEGVMNMYNRAISTNTKYSIGYAADYKIKYNNNRLNFIRNNSTTDDENTTLIYCTTGHFLNILRDSVKYLNDNYDIIFKYLGFCDLVFVDEPHKHTIDSDLCLSLLKYLLVTHYDKNVPNVICTSATYYEEKLYNFDLPYNYDINVIYANIDRNLNFYERIDVIGESIVNTLISLNFNGICLVFLPGISEIKRVETKIKQIPTFECDIVIAHSSSSEEEKKNIYSRNNKCKIILATNMIEQSITIENLSLIFDSMIEKINVCGANETINLTNSFISQDSAEQRKGRLGRTCPGILVRMMTEKHYNELPKSILPEIERLPITNQLLLALDCNVDYRFIFGDKINSNKKIENCFNIFTYFGLVQKYGSYYKLTKLGKFLSDSQINYKSRIFIYGWLNNKNELYEAVVFSVLLEESQYIFNMFGFDKRNSKQSCIETLLTPWNDFTSHYNINEKKYLEENDEYFDDFCSKYGITKKQWIRMINKLTNTMSLLKKSIKQYEINIDEFIVKAKPYLKRLYFKYNKVGGLTYKRDNKEDLLELSNSLSTDFSDKDYVYSLLNLRDKTGKYYIFIWI